MPQIPLRIDGMHCAACVLRVEKVIKKVPGVVGASVNFATGQATVECEGTPEEALIVAVEKAGYGARLPREVVEAREEQEAQRSLKRQWRKAAFAGIVAVPALAMMVPGLIPHEWMGRYNALLLAPCAAVMVYSGADFYRGAWKGLKEVSFDMNSLIAAGTLASFLHAVLMLLHDPHGHSYLDGIPVTIGAVLAGQAWEASARRNTGKAMRALLELAPAVALKLSDDGEATVPVATLKKGDRVRVLPGERVPVDGVVVDGKSTVDRSMLTGEPIPELVEPGQAIVGGTLNGGGLLTIQVGAVGEEAVLARMVALLQKASATRPPIASLADRVAGIFVPVVLGISALSFLGWWAVGNQSQGIQAALAVLVVACPCALGLATPISLVLGLGNAAKQGILLRSGEALQGLAEVDTVVFDKTGTLTVGHPVMQSMQAEGMEEAELLRFAAAVERRVIHPLARAVVQAAPDDLPEVEGLQSYPGKGAEGTVEGRKVRVGSPAWLGVAPPPGVGTTIAVEVEGGGRGFLRVSDPVRPNAAATVEGLKKRGLRVVLLSGDQEAEAKRVGQSLGIDEVFGGVDPAGKIAKIQQLRTEGRKVLMVGDGVNDAPALAAATVGVAMGSGADAAMEAAAVTLQRSDPLVLLESIDIARATLNNVRQNLGAAFGYNSLALPLAALGMLQPAIAGALMALSSVTVVGNALRLRGKG